MTEEICQPRMGQKNQGSIRGKMSTLDETKNRGSTRHRPPPHPPLIDSYFVVLRQVYPCGKVHLLKHMRVLRHMIITICRTTMLNLY